MTGFIGENKLLINCNSIDLAKLDGIKQVAARAGIEAVACDNVRNAVVQTDYNSIAELQEAAAAAPKVIGPDGKLSVDTRGYDQALRAIKQELATALKESGLQEAITDASIGLPQGKKAEIREGLRR